MQLIDAFIHNPVKISVAVLLLALFGVLSLNSMPMQLTPEVQTPTITIETRWPGGSPQEVEREIVLEQEEQLKGVEGVRKMSSESLDSLGRITLEFNVGTDMSEALLVVNSRLQQVPEYPEDADQPVISKSNSSGSYIAWFMLIPRLPEDEQYDAFVAEHPELSERIETIRRKSNPGLQLLHLREFAAEHPEATVLLPPPDVNVDQMRRFAEDTVEARFERVKGVSNSNVVGGLLDEMQVIVDPQRLAARQLTIGDVRRVLRAQNDDVSAGDFWEGKRRWVVRTIGQFQSPDQVSQQLLAVRDGAPVYVRDVADVKHGYKKPTGLVRRFGGSCVAINVERETGANVLDVMDGLRKATEELNAGPMRGGNVALTQVYDETDYIYSAVDLVEQNIYIGGALTMIVLMTFLHLGVRALMMIPLIAASALASAYLSPWFFVLCLAVVIGAGFWFARGALVVGLAIPISIIGTFLVLGMLGRTLNVISLAGMAFAVGMLVDNAIVVLENIYTHYSRGEPPFSAAAKATQEVWGAVVASTLTTVAVFIPVVFIQEEAGQLFRDIALAISAAVMLSMLVAVTVIPTAAARLFRQRIRGTEGGAPEHNGRESKAVQTPGGWGSRASAAVIAPISWIGRLFSGAIVGFNRWLLGGVLRRAGFALLTITLAVSLTWYLWPKVEYLPSGNRNLVFGILIPPPGYNLDQLMEMGEKVERDLRPYWDTEPGSPEAARLKYPVIGDMFFVVRDRRVFLGVKAAEPTCAGELVPLIQEVVSTLPGTFGIAKQSSLFEQGLGSGRSIDVEITGPDLEHLVGLGREVLAGHPEGDQMVGGVMQVIPGAQAIPVPSLDLSSPEVHVKPKLVQAAEMGIGTVDLGYAVNALVDGAYAGDYYLGADKIDLTIKGELAYAQRTHELATLPIATPSGQLIPLSAVADVQMDSGPEQVNHRERQRAITIQVSPPGEIALEDAMLRIREEIINPLQEQGKLDGGYLITLAGTADKLRQTWDALYINFLLAALITYLLMAALFESWLYPLVIILTVPMGAIGGILGLALLNLFVLQPLDVLTMLGFVILIGTVVNNPILIVHQSLLHIRHEGMTVRAAVLAAVGDRVRPIFMTTVTTVLGLLPLVLFPGAGSELYRGLGTAFLGGLIVSTLMTLLLVPTLFSLTMDLKIATWDRLFGTRDDSPDQAADERAGDARPVPAPLQPSTADL